VRSGGLVVAPVSDPAGLAVPFGDLWVAVTRAGGAVGFPPDAPEAEIRALAVSTLDAVAEGRLHMLALGPAGGDGLVGTVFLQPGAGPVVAHRATVLRLMIDPGRQRGGLGALLLAAAADHARTLGLDQLLLSARGGTGLPEFYVRQGWTEVGRFPGALRVGPGDVRDEHWFQLTL
jgi:acetyltransferase